MATLDEKEMLTFARDMAMEGVIRAYEEQGVNRAQLENFKQIFLKFNKNGTGEMDLKEIKEMMESLGENKTEAQIKTLIQDIDSSGNGLLSFQDFLKMMMNIKKTESAPSSPQSNFTASGSVRKSAPKRRKSFFSRIFRRNTKKSSEAEDNYELDPEYVSQIMENVFGPIKKQTGKTFMNEEEFQKVFKGKLGNHTTTKKFFQFFGNGEANIDPKRFLHCLGFLQHGDPRERLEKLFWVYDDDESGILEFNEVKAFLDQFMVLLKKREADYKTCEEIIQSLSERLEFHNRGDVTKEKFLEVGLQTPEVLYTMLPARLLNFETWANVFEMANFLLNENPLNEDTLKAFQLIKSSKEDKVLEFFKQGDIDLSAQDSSRLTLLHFAVSRNSETLASFMIERNADPNQKYKGGNTVLHIAAEKGYRKILQILLEKGAKINIQDESGWTPLHRAMRAGREEVGVELVNCINDLINRGANISLLDGDDCTVLDTCCRYGQTEHLDILVQKNADVNHLSKHNYTPLHWAANGGFTTCVKKLISLGANVNAKSSSGVTPLHLAASVGSLNCIEKLIEGKADVYMVDDVGRTALHYAAQNGDLRCVRFLILKGPDSLKMADIQNKTPYDYAKKAEKTEAARIIDEGPLKEQSEFSKELLQKFRNKEFDNVKQLLERPEADVHAANENGTTLLHYCAMQGRHDIMEILLNKDCNPNIGNNRGTTPIHKAVQRGQLGCVKLLLSRKADIDVQDDDLVTPLHRGLRELGKIHECMREKDKSKKLARKPTRIGSLQRVYSTSFDELTRVDSKNSTTNLYSNMATANETAQKITQCIMELLNKKPKLNLSDSKGYFPLDIAIQYGLTDLIDHLVNSGGDLQHTRKDGWQPIHVAAFFGHVSILNKLMKEYNVSPNTSTGVAQPVSLAIEGNHSEALKVLVSLGADVSVLESNGQNLLHVAARRGNPLILSYLMKDCELHKNVNEVDKFGNLPIHLACTPEIIEALATNESEINKKNNNGDTPLMFSIFMYGDIHLCKKYIECGAKIDEKNNQGLNALYVAAQNGCIECVKLLLNNGMRFHEENDDTIIFGEFEEDYIFPRVKKASLEGLISHLIQEKYSDEAFLRSFFFNFRDWLKPKDLLQRLIEGQMKSKKEPLLYDSEKGNDEKNVWQPPPGPLYALYYWLRNHYSDFNDPEMVDIFFNFVRNDIGVEEATVFQLIFSEKQKESLEETEVQKMSANLNSLTSFSFLPLLEVEPQSIAKQMTIIDSNLFKSIHFQELLHQAWNKKDAENKAKTIVSIVGRFNQVSSWVISEILNSEDKHNRAKVIQKFIGIAKECFDLQNFQATMQIVSGLESSAISRLKKTWKDVPSKMENVLLELKDQFSFEKNNKKYRYLMSQVEGTCVPFIGTTLQDLVFADDGNSDSVEENGKKYINFEKSFLIGEIIADLLHHQKGSYDFEKDLNMLSFLQNLPVMSNKEAFDRSLELEPRTSNLKH